VRRGRGPWLYITVDDHRNVLLLRGDGARDAIETLALEATWSRGGRGWVVDVKHVADVVAFCEYRHQLVVVSNRRPPETAGAA
jgi:hypothetical protein